MKKINKIIIITFIIMLISLGGIAMSIEETQKDIPSPINPNYIKQINDCGKLDLIDRASPNYNKNALTDGSLKGCND
jgi:hypothetical protein